MTGKLNVTLILGILRKVMDKSVLSDEWGSLSHSLRSRQLHFQGRQE